MTLVIRFSALGDVAMLASVLREAVVQHPEEHYLVLSREKMRPLFENIERVSFLPLGEPVPWKTIDRVMDAHGVWRSWHVDVLALGHLKPVRCIRKGRLSKWLLIRRHRHTQPDKSLLPEPHIMSAIDRYRRLFRLDTAPRSDRNLIVTSSLPHRNVVGTLSSPDNDLLGGNERLIGIAPFAAHKGKIYPVEKMEEVVRMLSEKGCHILLFGAGKNEKDILEQWASRYTGVTSLVGQQSLADDLQAMRSVRLMLTMDSGNMHLASLMGTRVISIWGATHPAMGFLGYGQRETDCIQLDLPCRPCSTYGKCVCRLGDYRCLDIQPEHIVQTIMNALCE